MAIDPYEIPRRLTQGAAKRLTAEQVEVIRRRLHDRRPTDELTAAEAAIYCGQSVRTIKRAIDADKGPHRLKNPDSTGSGAVNRHTRYIKSDLDAWRASLRSFDTITGRFNAFDDLVRDEPWLVVGGAVAGHLFDLCDIEDALRALTSDEVDFLRLDEALDGPWTNAETRQGYWTAFTKSVEAKVDAIQAAANHDELARLTG